MISPVHVLLLTIVMAWSIIEPLLASHQSRWAPSNYIPSSYTSYTSHQQSHPPPPAQPLSQIQHTNRYHIKRKHPTRSSVALQTSSRQSASSAMLLQSGPLSAADEARINELNKLAPEVAVLDYIERLQAQEACNQSVSLSRFDYTFSNQSYAAFAVQTEAAIWTANVLNNLFRTFESHNFSDDQGQGHDNTLYNDAFYYSLARALVEKDTSIHSSMIAFNRGSYRTKKGKSFCPRVQRIKSGGATTETPSGNGRFKVDDLAEEPNSDYGAIREEKYEWFWKQRDKNFSYLLFDKNSMCRQLNNGDHPQKVANHSVVITTEQEGMWSAPYYDCDVASGRASWLITYSVPFFGCDDGRQLFFKGVVAISIYLDKVDIQQCESDDTLFANTHKCHPSTRCKHVPGMGFRRGSYECYCKEDYFFKLEKGSYLATTTGPNRTSIPRLSFNGSDVERAYINKILNISDTAVSGYYDLRYQCLPCAEDCYNCTHAEPCKVVYNELMRDIPLVFTIFCMCVTAILVFFVVKHRRNRVMKADMWVLLTMFLLGAMMLYTTIVIHYFTPTSVTCMMIPWFREVGFAVVYGTIILKVYRILAEFKSRNAHRVHFRTKDLLKYLCIIIIVIVSYMIAWTTVILNHLGNGVKLVEEGISPQNQKFDQCTMQWWHYYVEIGEFLFLCFGIYLSYCIRSAPQEYGEPRYLCWSIYNETVWSVLLHITKHFWLSVHPDIIYIMYFIRCQITVSCTVILMMAPKFWYVHRPLEDEHFRNRAYSSSDVQDTIIPESMRLQVGVSSNGDVDVGDINLAEMDPEDIRRELKRLYTQLQIYKTRTMRKDNPHISKRRGGRKTTHRRFSLQAFHYKHRHHHSATSHSDIDHEHTELSKTPEESTNSAEAAVAIQMDGSSRIEEDSTSTTRTPTVTFKPGHKSFC